MRPGRSVLRCRRGLGRRLRMAGQASGCRAVAARGPGFEPWRSSTNADPIIVRKVRKHRPHAHHGGAWKVAYADFVTAMMAFFMPLWLLSNPDKGQLKGLAEYFLARLARGKHAGDDDGRSRHRARPGGHRRRAQAEPLNPEGEPSAEAGKKGTARGGTADIPERPRFRRLLTEMRVMPRAPRPTRRASAPVARLEQESRRPARQPLMDTGEPRTHVPWADRRALANDYTARSPPAHRPASWCAPEVRGDRGRGHTWACRSAARATPTGACRANGRWPRAGDGRRRPDAGSFLRGGGQGRHPAIYPDQPGRPENRRLTLIILGDPSVLPQDASFQFWAGISHEREEDPPRRSGRHPRHRPGRRSAPAPARCWAASPDRARAVPPPVFVSTGTILAPLVSLAPTAGW